MFKDMPKLKGVDYISEDCLTLYLNNIWKPYCTLVGMDGLPELKNATPT